MDDDMEQSLPPDRRRFLAWTAASVAFVAAHGRRALAASGSRGPAPPASGEAVRILSLELLTSAPLAEMREFYHRSLGLPLLEERAERIAIGAGGSRLTFVRAAPDGGKPFYHFAFNIPENKLLAARAWQKARGPLLPIPERLRDPGYPDDVVHFRHWNAHSVFFLDPGGNVVEYIARHDLANGRPGAFASDDILYASEIGLIVDDVEATAAKLGEVAGLGRYKNGDDQFRALGDERGLLLVMKRGRHLNFNPADEAKAARVFPTVARIRGPKPATYRFPDFPYELSLVPSSQIQTAPARICHGQRWTR